jgi:two-component system chemotaxis sensor kinase CheA
MTMTDNLPKKIMFVDDDKFLLDMYALKFTKAGYEVKTVDSTDTALKMLHEEYVPDVMLVDIVMPGMDGLDFVARVRTERLIQKTVIIMLTNQGTTDDIARARKVNVDGYIVKATTIPSEVLAEVEKICASKKN